MKPEVKEMIWGSPLRDPSLRQGHRGTFRRGWKILGHLNRLGFQPTFLLLVSILNFLSFPFMTFGN